MISSKNKRALVHWIIFDGIHVPPWTLAASQVILVGAAVETLQAKTTSQLQMSGSIDELSLADHG